MLAPSPSLASQVFPSCHVASLPVCPLRVLPRRGQAAVIANMPASSLYGAWERKSSMSHETVPTAQEEMISAGLQPAIPDSVGRCLIHWATRPSDIMSNPMTKTQNLHRPRDLGQHLACETECIPQWQVHRRHIKSTSIGSKSIQIAMAIIAVAVVMASYVETLVYPVECIHHVSWVVT